MKKHKNDEKIVKNDEKIKYFKRKSSNLSNSKAKSRHKHQYEDCLLLADTNYSKVTKAKYCTICGKISDVEVGMHKEVIIDELRGYRIFSDEEMLQKYKNLIKFHINDVYKDKYVNLKELK